MADDEKRAFFCDVMALADSVEDGEVLRLEFNGSNFTPSLFWATNEPPKTKRSPSTHDGVAPDAWWSGLSGGMRAAVRTLAGLVLSWSETGTRLSRSAERVRGLTRPWC